MIPTSSPREASGPDEERTYDTSVWQRWARELVLVVVSAFILLALLQHFVGRLYVVPSGSMEPALHGCEGCTNDRIAVEKLSFYTRDPRPGDVVVFAGEASWNADFSVQRSNNVVVRGAQNLLGWAGLNANDKNTFVKRVIATEGQTVSCLPDDDGIRVDGELLSEPYLASGTTTDPRGNSVAVPINPATGSAACGGDYFGPVEVPEDRLWVMGDNRTNSRDSRAHLGDKYQGTIGQDRVRGRVVGVVYPLSRFGGVDTTNPQETSVHAAG